MIDAIFLVPTTVWGDKISAKAFGLPKITMRRISRETLLEIKQYIDTQTLMDETIVLLFPVEGGGTKQVDVLYPDLLNATPEE